MTDLLLTLIKRRADKEMRVVNECTKMARGQNNEATEQLNKAIAQFNLIMAQMKEAKDANNELLFESLRREAGRLKSERFIAEQNSVLYNSILDAISDYYSLLQQLYQLKDYWSIVRTIDHKKLPREIQAGKNLGELRDNLNAMRETVRARVTAAVAEAAKNAEQARINKKGYNEEIDIIEKSTGPTVLDDVDKEFAAFTNNSASAPIEAINPQNLIIDNNNSNNNNNGNNA